MTAVVVAVERGVRGLSADSLESLSAARQIAGTDGAVRAIALGQFPKELLPSVAADRLRIVTAFEPPGGSTSVLAAALTEWATESGATVVVVAASPRGRELAGRVAARWDAGVVSGVTEVRGGPDAWTVVRPIFGGRATQELLLPGPRAVVAIRPHAFPPAAAGPSAPEVEERPAPDVAELARSGAVSSETPLEAGAGPGLSSASIVVSGGRGLRSAENFHLVEELAQALGAAVGASRAVTDAGWRPASYQVGQTGVSVSPQLYIAVGISGAIQHLTGMMSSRVIVAINSDPQAPIFRVADYGIAGDLFTVVPALTKEVRRVRTR
ncbi:MAG TPA: electron transfer flavoprotein subunit alpha/FixB family protein [Thermoplasmata archaeon]|nr:electron transfer flavoprotein subunit alpha/FixB family protein [Thermoplasmata archaeon]